MFSEALKMIDQNTVQYMIELQQQELDEAKTELDITKGELDTTKGELDEAKTELDIAKGELDMAKGELDEAKTELDITKGQLEESEGRLALLVQSLIQKCRQQGKSKKEIVEELWQEYKIPREEVQEAIKSLWE